MKRILFFIVLINTSSAFALHPVHLSVINMSVNQQEKSINYSVRLFQEDIITLIQHLHYEAGHDKKEFLADSLLIENYLASAFKVTFGSKTLTPVLTKKTNNELEIWLHFTIKLEKFPDKISIENKILLEIFVDQVNLFIFSCGNQENGITFDAKNTSYPLSINCD